MKKTAIILGAAFLFATAAVNAQTDSTKQPVTTTTTTTETAKVYNDKYNNWSADKYKMLPMPEALTTEKIFPTIGTYTVSSADPVVTTASTTESTTTENAASSTVTITLDETSKGIVWVDGLPQGKFKAYLRKSPGVYMIPAQTVNEKEMGQGVLIYDKDANKLDVCIGCTYNNDDPASAFAAAPVEPVVEEPVVKTTKNKKTKAKTKAKPVVKTTWKYSGSKNVEASASAVTPMQ